MTLEEFRSMALSLKGTTEAPHFDRIAFKTKRIFATIDQHGLAANLKLTPIDQSTFCGFKMAGVFPVPNKWGLQGWTTFELNQVPPEIMEDALQTAYQQSLSR